MAEPSRGGEGRRGSGRRRRSEVSSCPSAATGRSSGRAGSGTTGGRSLRDSATTGSGRRRRRPPSPVTTLASIDPDEMRNCAVDPDGNTAYSSRGGASSPNSSGNGNGPVDGEEEFASSRRSRRLASIERRAQQKDDNAEQKQKEKIRAQDAQKGALVVADAASSRKGSRKGSRKSERRGSSRGEGELSSEAKRYAARARQKASLMTNHDFHSRSGRSGGRSSGRSGRESKSASKATKASRESKQSKSTGKTTKESATTGEPSWISGQMSISKAGTRDGDTKCGTQGTQTGTLEGTLEETFISGALSVSKKSYRSNIDSKTRSWNYERGNIYREEEEDVGEAEEEEEAYEEWTASTSTLPDMTDRTIGGLSGRTSVSSMTSTDSYVREQRYLHQLKLEELQARRELRAEQRRRAMAMGEYFDDGTCEEEDTVFIGADESGLGSFAAGTYDQTRTSGRSSRRSSSRRSSGRSRLSQCSATHDQIKAARQTYDESYNQSSRDRSRRTRASRSSSRHSSRRSSQDGTPVYQREECCIKHPAVLLQSQTNVNVWTCERYIKDEESGRWHTAKMVCRACLDEAAEDGRYERQRKDRAKEDPKSYRSIALTARTEDSYYSDESDEDTTGSTSSPEGSSVPSNGTWTKAATVGVRPLEDQTPLEREAEAQRRRFVRRLAARAYHFPGNSWWEDWVQYTKNTHLVFGIFLHHRLHPVTSRERCVILLGSVAVGMMMSNIIYLWFVHYEFRKDDVVLNLWGLDVTKLMVTLWTVGSMAHTGFDLAIWHIKACTACRYFGGGHVHDGAVRCGRRVGVTIVLITLAFSSYLVLLRASEDYEAAQAEALAEAGDKLEGLDDDAVKSQGESFLSSVTLGGGAEHFDFLLGYIIEFVLAVFVYNPLILTVVFTGVLGCNGRIPILGGRPREVAREERYARKRQQYTMPRVLKLGDVEYEADGWGDPPATNF